MTANTNSALQHVQHLSRRVEHFHRSCNAHYTYSRDRQRRRPQPASKSTFLETVAFFPTSEAPLHKQSVHNRKGDFFLDHLRRLGSPSVGCLGCHSSLVVVVVVVLDVLRCSATEKAAARSINIFLRTTPHSGRFEEQTEDQRSFEFKKFQDFVNFEDKPQRESWACRNNVRFR